ncbi:hypothetical protein [Lacrimispora algidixylanolytica]|uniref:Uncharacterized protein n=1 Tax=Lacrimispora algidixylanolytica TaxID=94868 RepID=A0A419TCD2_9FIRM|nr:hypothetical protein [Lacrimispora algidixylanolytica]RKD35141.1 hypothetical protein BET01_02000 [Lacrimispora algidixylanolytica]
MTRQEFRSALKPITDGLFGKQNTRGYERPKFTVRPLEEMLKDLADIPVEEWYGYAFSREPLNGKFTDEQRRDWMRKSLDCGREYAQKVRKEYGTSDPVKLADSLSMSVSYPEVPDKTDRVLFAEYRIPNKICIYMDAVNKANKLLLEPQVLEILTEELDVCRLLLSHELFHFVEETYRQEIFTQTEKVRLWSLGFLHNDSIVIALSEIAAMGFAKELMGLSYSPYLMDVFLVYGYSPQEASGLYEEMMELSGRKNHNYKLI